jgi:hypothetical protein
MFGFPAELEDRIMLQNEFSLSPDAGGAGSFSLQGAPRAASGPPIITDFSPTSGLPGTRVTINGANFSVADPVDRTVMFSVTEAVVESASATSIVAIVPLGATTGLIHVGTPSGSATSTSNFTVTATPPVIS